MNNILMPGKLTKMEKEQKKKNKNKKNPISFEQLCPKPLTDINILVSLVL